MDAVAYRSEGGRIVSAPYAPGALADDEVLVEQVAFALDARSGTSAVGYVRAVGAGLTSERARLVDRLVALPALRACGACLACRRGHAGLCARPGEPPPLSSHGRVAARLAVAFIPPASTTASEEHEPPYILAALGGVGLDAYVAVVRAGVEPNRAALILGSGPLAAFVIALVQHRGATAIRIERPDEGAEQQIELALRAADVEGFGLPLIDTRARTDGWALSLARSGGTVVLCGQGGAALDPGLIVARELTVLAAGGAHPDLLPELCAFAASGNLPLLALCRRVEEAEAAALLPRRGGASTSNEDLADERVAVFVPAGLPR